MLILGTNLFWATRQVYFSNDFVQYTLVEDVYLTLWYHFDSDAGEDRDNMFMKLNKSIYGLIK